MIDSTWSRRDLLRVGGATGIAAGIGLPLLSGCSNNGVNGTTVPASKVKVPDYLPFKGPKPDLAGTKDGVLAGYYSYPSDPPQTVRNPPVKGGTVSALLITHTPPPTPEPRNACWQEIEKRGGSKLKLNLVSAADYQTKFSTMMAGNDLPDLMAYTFYKPVPHLPEFLQAKCADLTELITGDAVKAWPNLANIPQIAWRNSAVNGKIFGIPVPIPVGGSGFFYHQAMLDEVGAELPKNADDFLSLLKEVTNPKASRWGFVGPGGPFALAFAQAMWRVPQNWKVDTSGNFTKDIETPENKEALAYTRKLFQAGVFYPGMQGFGGDERKNAFNAGKAFMTADGFTAYPAYWHDAVKGTGQIKTMLPPGHDGGQGTLPATPGYYSITMIKKGDQDRVKQLLGLCNLFAAPFGSQEYLLLRYGAEKIDYTLDHKGNPTQTTRGQADLPTSDNPWPYFVASGPQVFYDPSSPAYVRAAHQAMIDGLPLCQQDPTAGLYSATNTSKATTLDQTVSDAFVDIVTGHRPMSDYDKIISDWRSQGGDQIRKEYQQAWKQAKK